MVDGTEGTTLGKGGEASERREPPTIVVGRSAAENAAPEPPTTPIAHAQNPEPVTGDEQGGHDSPAPPERTEPVWPGLTAAGLPTRVPRQADEEAIKEAFAQSWEASPTGQTPLTRKPFTPTYLSEPPRPDRAWSDLDPTELLTPPASEPAASKPSVAEPSAPESAVAMPTLPGPAPVAPAPAAPTSVPAPSGSTPEPKEPPDPREPPEPAEPPQPHQPPEPKEPPRPPVPPGPSPFPTPTPVPTPPEPMPPSPVPSPVPPRPPSPPVPSPPPPFPPPPGPVPPPPTVPTPSAPPPAPAPKVTTPPPAPSPVPVIVPGPPTRTTGATRAPAPRPAIGTSTYQGGAYTELTTEPITVTGSVVPASMEMSGSLTGHLLSRNQEQYRRRERRRKVRTAMWVTTALAIFATAIAVIVNMLAGDFIRSIFATFSDWAG